MNILYVITGLGLGGAEKVVVNLADQMTLLGHNVKIAYLTGEVLVKPASSDVEIIALHLNSVRDFLPASKKYQRLIENFSPDVIHAHMVHANLFARLNRAFCQVPKLICTAHSSNEGGKVRMFAYRLTNRLSDINTNVSQTATEEMIRKGAFTNNDLITVYNGINLDEFNTNPKTTKLDRKTLNLISVGSFSDPKDYPNLINAFGIVKNRNNTDIKLTIVGDGKLRPVIESLIKELSLEKDITLLGRRSDISELLNASDIFLLASKFEGFGLVVAEAMACECYVVATDSGGVAEVMGDSGRLVPIKDSEALAEAIEQTISLSKKDILKNNKKARDRIERFFSLEASIQKWLDLYEA